ncbi:MAG: hypothetical protein U1F35_18105 [Steroidobacteraceae bacterium]
MNAAQDKGQVQMDATQVYREDTFTDRRVGTIRRMTPVSANGEPDPARPVLYVGQAQIMTPMGALPLSFEIDADSLASAITQFGPAAEAAVQQTMKELQEMRRESASSLVIPEAGGAALANPNDLLGGRGGRIRR